MNNNLENLVKLYIALNGAHTYILADKINESGRDLHDLTVRELLALIDEVDK